LKITFLGTGGSLGVPMIGCGCNVCTSSDPRNRRLRPSLWIRHAGSNILIDAATDFRLQALENGLGQVDSILFTHAHADHCLGLDDMRIVVDRQRRQVPVHASTKTLEVLRRMFGYMFSNPMWESDVPRLRAVPVDGRFELCGLWVEPVEVLHHKMTVLAYRFGPATPGDKPVIAAAYVTDVSEIPPASEERLRDLELLIIGALRYKPHVKHFSLEQTLDFALRVGARRVLLTHMSHDLDYSRLLEELPERVEPAFDGMTVEL